MPFFKGQRVNIETDYVRRNGGRVPTSPRVVRGTIQFLLPRQWVEVVGDNAKTYTVSIATLATWNAQK
jgi:hypothetical protein